MPKKGKHKMAETLDSNVLVFSNTKQYQVQLKLLLDQSPYLEGICYPPISRIYFQQFNDGVIKRVIQFCKYERIQSYCNNDDIAELMKFAEQTKMVKLMEYINHASGNDSKYPHIEAQGAFFEIPAQTDVSDDDDENIEENDESEITDNDENRVLAQVCYINTIMIKPPADKPSEDRIRAQSYIPQDPLHTNSFPAIITIQPPTNIPSTKIPHQNLSRTPSTADEAEEGILGAQIYESVSYVPNENLTLRSIPASTEAENPKRTFFQRIRALFS